MASKKKPVVVTITKSRHKTQPYSVTIDKPGNSEPYTMKERYTRPDSARRGALRNLKAWLGTKDWFVTDPKSGAVTWIEFVYSGPKSSTKKK